MTTVTRSIRLTEDEWNLLPMVGGTKLIKQAIAQKAAELGLVGDTDGVPVPTACKATVLTPYQRIVQNALLTALEAMRNPGFGDPPLLLAASQPAPQSATQPASGTPPQPQARTAVIIGDAVPTMPPEAVTKHIAKPKPPIKLDPRWPPKPTIFDGPELAEPRYWEDLWGKFWSWEAPMSAWSERDLERFGWSSRLEDWQVPPREKSSIAGLTDDQLECIPDEFRGPVTELRNTYRNQLLADQLSKSEPPMEF